MIAQSLPYTLTSLDSFAKWGSVDPISLFGGKVVGLFPDQSCRGPWPRHNWQQLGVMSREDILNAVLEAEKIIRNHLGYPVAPMWIRDQEIRMPRHHNRQTYRTNATTAGGREIGFPLGDGYLIEFGTRATEEIGLGADVVYSDEDGDSFSETATITIAGDFTTYDWREIFVYHPGKSADPRWQIRWPESVTVTDTEMTIVIKVWLLVDPDVDSEFPGAGGYNGIDMSSGDNLISTVDVYRVYNSPNQVPPVTAIWEPKPDTDSSTAGQLFDITQAMYARPRSENLGYGVLVPATYDAGTDAYTQADWLVSRKPDRLKASYYAGYVSDEYREGLTQDPLDAGLREALIYLAVARTDYEWCGCDTGMIANLREDLAFSSEQGNFLAIMPQIEACPFGTRRGEWMAWNKLKTLPQRPQVAHF